MAGNKKVLDNPTVPDPEDAYLYAVKNGLDYKVKVGGNLSLAFLGPTGQFPLAQVPDLPASQITSGTFPAARIPALDAGILTTGLLNLDRIPGLPAAQITTGTFTAARIPNLDASKITTGVFPIARIATGTPDGTKFVRDDGTLAVPATAAASWGSITGTLSNQTDLQNSLNTKANTSNTVTTDTAQTITGAKTLSAPLVSTSTIRGRVPAAAVNAAITLGTAHLNTVVEKSDNAAYTYTLPVTFAAHGDIITVLNSGTAGNITVARQGGVDLYKGATNADITVTPGTSANLYRSANDNRWLVL